MSDLCDLCFEGRTGRGVRVAVIDSGIAASHPHVAGIAGGVEIGPGGTLGADTADLIGHATAVAAAIREKSPGFDGVRWTRENGGEPVRGPKM